MVLVVSKSAFILILSSLYLYASLPLSSFLSSPHFERPIILGVDAEVFTASAHVERVLDAESHIVHVLNHYLKAEELKLNKIRRYVNKFAKHYSRDNTTSESIVGNPLNAYLLVKRLTSDWSNVQEVLGAASTDTEVYIKHFKDYRLENGFPDNEDLTGVANALARLQQTYQIDTHSLARGQIRGVRNSPKLSAEDCYLLGRQFFYNSEYGRCLEWMREALRLYMIESNNGASPSSSSLLAIADDGLVSLYEHIAYCAYQIGKLEEAVMYGRKLVALAPTHPRANDSLVYYERDFDAEQQSRRRGEQQKAAAITSSDESAGKNSKTGKTGLANQDEWQRDRTNYEILCRGDRELPERISRRLKCYTTTRKNHPFWIVQPLRVEEMYLSPYIVMLHNVLFEHEIVRIKQIATEHLQRATVQNPDTGALETANYRISKSAWFNRAADPVVNAVTTRVGYMTGLDPDIAEELQVANYGIGGHYEPHFDFARPEEKDAFKSLGMGNRLATLLFYMSDVEAGGATVFPRLDLALWPRKGSAVFWYNLKRNGDGDYRTRHAGCPVLSGVKWISNKWIHEDGQWLYRPCSLDPKE